MSSLREKESSEMPLRIGTVPYCNAWPLTHFLPTELPGVLLSTWIPSSMRLRLMAHHLDLAMMPVAELMNLPYGKIVSNCCIACRGPVRSVRIVCRKPIEEIRTLSLDTSSRSSVTACELILRHFYDLRPTRYKLHADRPLEYCKTDAFVVIGDRALAFQAKEPWNFCYDLGELWLEKTGLPFVFAAWIGCSERAWSNDRILQGLASARDRGLGELDRMLDEKETARASFPIFREQVKDYFENAIIYRLGKEEKLGLQSYFDLALLHGLTKHRTVLDILE